MSLAGTDTVVMAERRACRKRGRQYGIDQGVVALERVALARAHQREIDAATVGIGVAEVREHERKSTRRPPYRVVNRGQAGPGRRHLQCVVESTMLKDLRLPVTHGVAVREPRARRRLTQAFSRELG